MKSHSRVFLFGLALLTFCVAPAFAGVTVNVVGNQAIANISLQSGVHTYTADVTITFDSPINLSAKELNLTAQLVNPNDLALQTRLGCLLPLLGCPVTIDPAFPMMITVEPLKGGGSGYMSFLNAYQFEIHTSNLDCSAPHVGATCSTTVYRLFKAPVNGPFSDISQDVLKGSVRARGTGGSFSQFLITRDTRNQTVVYLLKFTALQVRVLELTVSNLLRGQLTGLLARLTGAVLAHNYSSAIGLVDQLLAVIEAQAGITIDNIWDSSHLFSNDAGDIESLANTLRFTLVRLQNGG